MTKDQEQLVTLLHVKYGGFQAIVDMWLHSDERLTTEELDAVDSWMNDDTSRKPYNVKKVNNPEYPFIVAEILLETPEKD